MKICKANYSVFRILLSILGLFFAIGSLQAQTHSIARRWNEINLEAIRNDFAWPVVHARNLFHISAAMYDAWAVFDEESKPYFLGRSIAGYEIPFEGFDYDPAEIESFRHEAISYAVYRIMYHRYYYSPDFPATLSLMNSLMNEFGYDPNYEKSNYLVEGTAASLGNYIGEQIIYFGWQDGANEDFAYTSDYYQPVNDPLNLQVGGDNFLNDPNRWQPLQFGSSFIDQSGNPIDTDVIDFLGPEWGNVVPFALTRGDLTQYERDGNTYNVYVDPGPPAYLDEEEKDPMKDMYKWGFAMVASWSSQLDPSNGKMIDICPTSIGNLSLNEFPVEFSNYPSFYDFTEGEENSEGYRVNPYTNEPYETNIVPKGDYARVLAEFWADGPDSETPPGHWFTILNYVNDHPLLERKLRGQGEELSALEWDVKAYFTLGATMHDVAVAAWSVKGYYDYIRPISAIRYMATMGQSSDETLPNYHPHGLPLINGRIELIEAGDPLAGSNNENINELKVYSWKGHDFIDDPEVDQAGVGWILAKDWWPYQRPTFVTPPFAGYVSGHSTFSRAAAEVLTLLTGDAYFPGGIGEFYAKQNEFLVFEKGPTVDVTLQWAKYYDAADQCSLSRIWGGIHTPIDDLNGRIMGEYIGTKSFNYAESFFTGRLLDAPKDVPKVSVYPNPTPDEVHITSELLYGQTFIEIRDLFGKKVHQSQHTINTGTLSFNPQLNSGIYLLMISSEKGNKSIKLLID